MESCKEQNGAMKEREPGVTRLGRDEHNGVACRDVFQLHQQRCGWGKKGGGEQVKTAKLQ